MQGKTIIGFELKRLLGKGGMAEVWYADNQIHKAAAVKIINADLSQNDSIRERFRNEAEVMVKLNHPNIRQVYGYGYLGKRHCIVMEYLEGSDLEELMKNGRRFTDEELRRWWNQTVDALNYTHAMGVVHRDIKPSNIFLDEKGNIKLLDFGIAKMMENASLTQTGMVMGTPMYMSPEQVNDIKHVDYHTDLYSLAVSFVHMLTGKKPYDDTNCSVFEIQMNIVTKPLDMSEVPANWQGFLAPYLEKDPQKRPALRHFEEVNPKKESTKPVVEPSPKPQSKQEEPKAVTPEPSEKPKSKKGLWIGLGVAAVAAVLLVLFLMKPKEEPVTIDPDTMAYQACRTADDYRSYMRDFGRNGLHYSEAKALVDQYMADSIAKAQKTLAEAQAKQQRQEEAEQKAKAEAEQKAKAEAEQNAKVEAEQKAKAEADRKAKAEAEQKAKAEAEQRAKAEAEQKAKAEAEQRVKAEADKKARAEAERKAKAETEQKAKVEAEQRAKAAKEKEAYDKCTTIAACNAYLKAYPEGKYAGEVKRKKLRMESDALEDEKAEMAGSGKGKEEKTPIIEEGKFTYRALPDPLFKGEDGNVSVDVVINIPGWCFEKRAAMNLKVYFEYGYKGERINLPPLTFIGEKVNANNGYDFRVNYNNGGEFTKHYSIPYQDEMKYCELKVEAMSYKYDGTIYRTHGEIMKNARFSRGKARKIADGTITK